MGSFIKLVFLAIAAAVVCMIVKQYKPEYAVVTEISAICVGTVYALSFAGDLLKSFESSLGFVQIESQGVKILIKALGIAVVTGISGDICRDSGNSALAGTVEFAGKITIMILAIPLIKEVLTLAAGLINS